MADGRIRPHYNRRRPQPGKPVDDNSYVVPPPLPPRNTPSDRPLSTASVSPAVQSLSDVPPPLPTSLRPCHRAVQSTSDQPQKPVTKIQGDIRSRLLSAQSEGTHTDSGSEDDERLTLSELIKKHSQSFPLRVRVMKGFYGERGEENAIASGEEYNIHFVKRTKVVKIKDNYGHNTFIVPFNSAARFGIIYRGGTTSRGPKVFDTVSEVMATVPLPKVLCAKCSYYGSDSKSSVGKDEVLIVQGVHKVKLGFGRSMLKVMSVAKREEKSLPRDCIGQFTTDPYCTQMYLPELLSSISDLPLIAKMYLDVEGDTFPEYLISEPVTLAEQFTERSVVATLVDTEAVPGDVPNTLVDLPTSLDIEVTVIYDKDAEKAKLYEDTCDIYTKFDPSMLRACMDASSDDTYAAQSQFLATIRDGHETEGLQLEMPKYQPLRKSMMDDDLDDYQTVWSPPPTPLSNNGRRLPPRVDRLLSGGSQDGAHDIPPRPKEQLPTSAQLWMRTDIAHTRAEAPPPPPKPMQRKVSGDKPENRPEMQLPVSPKQKEGIDGAEIRVEALSSPQLDAITDSSLSSQLDSLRVSIQNLHTRMGILESAQKFHSSGLAELSQIKDDCGNLVPIAQQLAQSCRLLEARMKRSETQLDTNPPPLPPRRASIALNSELATLSQMEILKLLDLMDMRKYQKKFAQESIDGALLLQCDELTLQNELEVTSKLDRVKLIKVITGQHSALRILEGDDAYVQFAHTLF